MATKAAVRAEALGRRAALSHALKSSFAVALAAEGSALVRGRAIIASAFLPIRGEPDTMPLLAALAEAGIRTALPSTPPRGEPLRFRAWRPGAPLVAGRFGISEPAPDAAELDPDVLFVPLAAFDRRGFRLGYGAGYYDGALHRLRRLKTILAVGVAFAAQEVVAVPTEPHDARLDAVLTEGGLIAFGSDPTSGPDPCASSSSAT